MKKARRTSPRRLQVCLNLLPSELLQNPSTTKQKKPVQSTKSPQKQKQKYCTHGRTPEPEQTSQRGIIRLGSKKKLLLKQSKQNIEPPKQQTQLVNKKEAARNSLSKYFNSNRSIKYLDLNRNNVSSFDSQCGKRQHRFKTEVKGDDFQNKFDSVSIKSNNSRNLSTSKNGVRLLSMSREKSLKTFIQKRQQKRDRSCSLNKQFSHIEPERKLNQRLQKLKQYKFVQEYLSDCELEGIFNELQLANVPEIRWSLIIVDKVYQIMRKRQFNDYSGEVIRKF